MASYFFDSSALFKRYVAEMGSAWVLGITDPAAANDIYVVHITGVEIVSALVRQDPPLPPAPLARALADFQHDFQNQYQRISVNEALVARAMRLAEAHRLRGYDAVQLAAALELHDLRQAMGLPPLTVISADAQLNGAAILDGLPVDDPLNHP